MRNASQMFKLSLDQVLQLTQKSENSRNFHAVITDVPRNVYFCNSIVYRENQL